MKVSCCPVAVVSRTAATDPAPSLTWRIKEVDVAFLRYLRWNRIVLSKLDDYCFTALVERFPSKDDRIFRHLRRHEDSVYEFHRNEIRMLYELVAMSVLGDSGLCSRITQSTTH